MFGADAAAATDDVRTGSTPGFGKFEVGSGAEVVADFVQAIVGGQGGFVSFVCTEGIGIDAKAHGAAGGIQRSTGGGDGRGHDFGVAAIKQQGIGANVHDNGNGVSNAFATAQARRIGRGFVIQGEGGPKGVFVWRKRVQGAHFGGAALGFGQP